MPNERLVYLKRGGKAHLVKVASDGQPLSADIPCIRCGTKPRAWERWYGTQGFAEHERADQLELCLETIRRK